MVEKCASRSDYDGALRYLDKLMRNGSPEARRAISEFADADPRRLWLPERGAFLIAAETAPVEDSNSGASAPALYFSVPDCGGRYYHVGVEIVEMRDAQALLEVDFTVDDALSAELGVEKGKLRTAALPVEAFLRKFAHLSYAGVVSLRDPAAKKQALESYVKPWLRSAGALPKER
jgi:hypothetical protein